MMSIMDGTVSVMISSSGSALRARVRAGDAVTVDRALAAVRDDAAAMIEPVCATTAIRPAGQGAEGDLEIETSGSVSRRALRRISVQTECSMRRLGYMLDREVICDGGQIVSVYARARRHRA